MLRFPEALRYLVDECVRLTGEEPREGTTFQNKRLLAEMSRYRPVMSTRRRRPDGPPVEIAILSPAFNAYLAVNLEQRKITWGPNVYEGEYEYRDLE